jgi:hypothetical protein
MQQPTRSRFWAATALLALAVFAFAPSAASAQFLIDPSTLQIGPQIGTSLDPVQIGGTGQVTVTNVSNGAGDLNVPWLVILGIPNVTTTTAQITSGPGTGYPVSGTFVASMTSGQEAYSQLSLDAGTNNSNSFTNWSGAELSILNITATSFGLFEFSIPATLSGGGTDTFQFSNLPVGTFVIAYGQTSTHIYDTPFTEAGLETGSNQQLPAPPSAVLLGLGGLGFIGFVARPRFRRKAVAA